MSLLRVAEGQALRSPATCVMQGAKSCGVMPENKVFSTTEDSFGGFFRDLLLIIILKRG